MMRSVAALGAVLLLAACHAVYPVGGELQLSVEPSELKPGRLITVRAKPIPPAELHWVSGTVKVMGASQVPFAWDPEDGLWKFKTMIPIFLSIPPGVYETKAWGLSRVGRRYEGMLKIEIK